MLIFFAGYAVTCSRPAELHYVWGVGVDCLICFCLEELSMVCASCGGCRQGEPEPFSPGPLSPLVPSSLVPSPVVPSPFPSPSPLQPGSVYPPEGYPSPGPPSPLSPLAPLSPSAPTLPQLQPGSFPPLDPNQHPGGKRLKLYQFYSYKRKFYWQEQG